MCLKLFFKELPTLRDKENQTESHHHDHPSPNQIWSKAAQLWEQLSSTSHHGDTMRLWWRRLANGGLSCAAINNTPSGQPASSSFACFTSNCLLCTLTGLSSAMGHVNQHEIESAVTIIKGEGMGNP